MSQLQRFSESSITEKVSKVLIRRMGQDRFGLWFGHNVRFAASDEGLTVVVNGTFALERLRSRHLDDLRAAVKEVCGSNATVTMRQPTSEETAAAGKMRTQALFEEDEACDTVEEPKPQQRKRTQGTRANDSRKAIRPGPDKGPVKLPVRKKGVIESESDPSKHSDDTTNQPERLRMTLGNFCIGSCNELAHTATRMVLDAPGSASPVYFWGPPGTGKTHLLHAIRAELRRRHRMRRVILLTAEDFTNDFTTAVRGSGLPAFRRRYRDVDALLVDDVQFFGGNKRATLRELQYTVDALIRTGKQLIFAADRPPLEVDGVSSELAGRMAGGMVCGTAPLDPPTRRNVIEQLSAVSGLALSDALLDSISRSVAGDGRLLAGVVNYVRVFVQMRGRLPDWNELSSSAGDLVRAGSPTVGMVDIQRAVCETFGLPSDALQTRGQTRTVSQPRMLAMYLARQYTRAAFSEIGDYFGKRSHSTVIAANKRVEDWLEQDSSLPHTGARAIHVRQAVSAIENLLRTG